MNTSDQPGCGFDRLTHSEKAALTRSLAAADQRFDPEAGLLWGVAGPARYHTRLEPGTPVHAIHESAIYAAAALAHPDTTRHPRAARMIESLLPLQESDPSSAWRGVWPWFAEEPVSAMAPPDPNFADFVAVPFIQILKADRLEAPLRARTETALAHAADAIRRREVRLSYTNIAIMGIFACVGAGEILGDRSLLAFGKKRLREFVRFTREARGFPEYNSPTYTVISLVELTRMVLDFADEEDIALAREVHDLAWQEIARHWHAPSGEWGGPHGRSYTTLLGSDTRAFIEKGTRGIVADHVILRLDWALLPARCPEEFLPCFTDLSPRTHHVSVASTGTGWVHRHTHHRPEFTLGSVERGTFWNQSRSLIGYAPGAQGPAAFTLRFLHDDYDFCAAHLLCVQSDAHVLGAICLAWDGGDKHPELDRFANREIKASDWRVRLEMFHLAPGAVRERNGRWKIAFGSGARLEFAWIARNFGGLPGQPEISEEDGRTHLDLVFHRGRTRIFRFDEFFPCHLSFALRVSALGTEHPWNPPTASAAEATTTLQWNPGPGSTLSLQAPTRPQEEKALRAGVLPGDPGQTPFPP